VIDASPETVWEFLVDPEKACRWMGGAATLDARPGGAYRVEVLPGNVAAGEFVEIELIPDGEGTTLRFTHRDLPTAEDAGKHAHGWDHYLARLAVAGADGDPGRDPWLSGEM
jgi:uncharacterized protein YndB with AHSA1/START domain